MARNWAPGDSQVYRVKVVRRKAVNNPNYRAPSYRLDPESGRWLLVEGSTGEPLVIFTEDTWTEYIGPYQQIGQAKAQLTRVTKSTWAQEEIVTADIEKGSIIWEVLDE